jgi:hypothetical protein
MNKVAGAVEDGDLVVLAAALMSLVLTVAGLRLMKTSHSVWGGPLSLALTWFLLISALYWSSPRFKEEKARRSFADFLVWGRECASGGWKTAKVLFRWAIALAFVWGLAVVGYRAADRAGRVMHRHNTPVWIQGNWMVGEYRYCDMPVGAARLFCSNPPGGESGLVAFPEGVSDEDAWNAIGAAYNQNAQTDWSALEKYFHVLPVRFYGRLQRPERIRSREIVSWRCQRRTDTLTCTAPD